MSARAALALGLAAVVAAPVAAGADTRADARADTRADDDSPFHDPAWRIAPSLQAGLEVFRYHEDTGNPALQSKHHGTLPTARVGVAAASPYATYFARAYLAVTDGHMAYDGTDQQGNPITGHADGHMTEAEGVVGRRWGIADRVWLGGYVGIGHRTWQRDLTPLTAGYLEEYAWSYVPLAFEADLRATSKLTLAFEAVGLRPFGGNLRAHFRDIDPSYATLDIDLDNDFGGRLVLSAAYAVTHALRVTALAEVEADSVIQGRGTPFLVNGVQATDGSGNGLYASEPYTYTTRYTLALGASYTF